MFDVLAHRIVARYLTAAASKGIRVRVSKPHGGLIVRAHVDKIRVGNLTVIETLRYMQVDKAMVLPEYRRKGVARMMYRRAAEVACRDFGKPLTSSHYQSSPDAKAFWRGEVAAGKAIETTLENGDQVFQYPC